MCGTVRSMQKSCGICSVETARCAHAHYYHMSYEEMITTLPTLQCLQKVTNMSSTIVPHAHRTEVPYLPSLCSCCRYLGQNKTGSVSQKRWEIHVLFSAAHRGGHRSVVGPQWGTKPKQKRKWGEQRFPQVHAVPRQTNQYGSRRLSQVRSFPHPLASTVTVDHPTVPTYLT